MHYFNTYGELPHYLLWWVNWPGAIMRIPESKRNANNAYVSVNNVLGIASVDYCLHIYNTIKTLFCQ